MQQIIEFILRYWKYFLIGLIVLIDLLLWLTRRKRVVFSKGVDFYERIISLVNEAEKLYVNGDDKLAYVLNNFLKDDKFILYDQKTTQAIINEVHSIVEDILSTPTKKGGPGRDEKA